MTGKKLQEETVKAAKTEKERRERAQKEHDKVFFLYTELLIHGLHKGSYRCRLYIMRRKRKNKMHNNSPWYCYVPS